MTTRAKRPGIFPENEPAPKRVKLEFSQEEEEEGEEASSATRLISMSKLRENIADIKAKREAKSSGVTTAPQTFTPPGSSWIPRLPVEANNNYRHEPTYSQVDDTDPTWHYSASLKGYCRYKCLGCGEFLLKNDVQHLTDHRQSLPQPLLKDSAFPPTWKLRTVPFCQECLNRVRSLCHGNPQAHNGRGKPFWVLPL